MKYAYTNGIILSGREDMSPLSGHSILTDGERIVDIVPAGMEGSSYKKIDLGGKYILPGLINLHVHLPANGKPGSTSDPVKKVRLLTSNGLFRRIVRMVCEGYARQQLMSGVTTIRTVGGVLSMDNAIRDRIAAGKAVGPRILASNMAVSVPGGHMAGSLAYAAESAEEARSYTARIAADRPDLIKLMITGGVLDAKVKGEPGELKMPAEYVKAACDEAHRHGLKVAAHVESPEGVRVALENGVDTIELGAKPDEDIIRLFKERGAAHVATLSPALPYALFDRSISNATETEQFNGQVVFDGIIACARACLDNGIPVGLGTDTGCPYITHYDMWREVNYFQRYCGVSNAFALYTATLGNARIAGISAETGSIEPGKCADMIVVSGDPLTDLKALRYVDMVIARGNLIQKPVVKTMPQVERELDKFL
ncbi:MAG: amidohydrolase family protein [Oscillospiraceae bacterium]|nr:amidohydrolase family protein [Oscillospiraceae bacterium]